MIWGQVPIEWGVYEGILFGDKFLFNWVFMRGYYLGTSFY